MTQIDDNSIRIYGASDDIVGVEGTISDEFYADNEDPTYLAFSDGTVLSVEYSSRGIWRINRIAAGSATYTKVESKGTDLDYTDVVTLTGNLQWVLAGSRFRTEEV